MTQILVWDLGLVICDFPHPLRARESSLQSSPESSPESFVESLFKSSFESSLQSSVQSSFKSSSQSSVQSSVQSSRKSSVKSLVQSSFKSSLESSLGVRPKTPFEAAPRQTGDRVTLDFSSLAQQLRLRPSGFSAALLGGGLRSVPATGELWFRLCPTTTCGLSGTGAGASGIAYCRPRNYS